MGRYGGKIGKPERQRVFEVGKPDAADRRTHADRIRAHEDVQLRHGRTSRDHQGRSAAYWLRRAATRDPDNTARENLFGTIRYVRR